MNKSLKVCGALAVTMTVLGVTAPAQAAELKVLRLPQVTAVSKSSAIRISSTELQEIKNQNYLYDRLEELPLSKDQVDGFVDRYKDGDKKADIIDEAKEQANKNLASETDAAKVAESAVKTAEESKSKDDVSKAREAVKALKFTKTDELTKRLDAVDADIKEAEAKAKAEAERKAAEEAAAKAVAEKKAAEEAAAAQAAAAQQAQAQAHAPAVAAAVGNFGHDRAGAGGDGGRFVVLLALVAKAKQVNFVVAGAALALRVKDQAGVEHPLRHRH